MSQTVAKTRPATRGKLAIVENDPKLYAALERHLRNEGFGPLGIRDPRECHDRLLAERPRLVIVDLDHPQVDGVAICQRLKHDPRTRRIPIILMSRGAKPEEIEAGLEAGADDYVGKPFSMKELTARLDAILRRTPAESIERGADWIVHESLEIDTGGHRVRIDGAWITLTAKEFEILKLLASRPGEVFSRDRILRSLCNHGGGVSPRNVDVHILSIRKKLGRQRDMIDTVRGVGYRLASSR